MVFPTVPEIGKLVFYGRGFRFRKNAEIGDPREGAVRRKMGELFQKSPLGLLYIVLLDFGWFMPQRRRDGNGKQIPDGLAVGSIIGKITIGQCSEPEGSIIGHTIHKGEGTTLKIIYAQGLAPVFLAPLAQRIGDVIVDHLLSAAFL